MNNQSDKKSNIIDFSFAHFPVGSKAWHEDYRVCQIVKSSGHLRTIRIVLLGEEENVLKYVTVHVNELKKTTIPLELQ